MATHILYIEPDEASAGIFENNVAMFMDAQVTKAHSAVDAVSLLEAGVRPDIALLTWDINAGYGPELVENLRDIEPSLPIALVLEEGAPAPPDVTPLNIQAVLNKPFYFPELRGELIQAIQKAAGTVPLPGNPKSIGMLNAISMPVASVSAPQLSEHISLTLDQNDQLVDKLQELELALDSLPMLLSQDGIIISNSSSISDDAAIALAKLAGRIWREGATQAVYEWLRFDDQLPEAGSDRRTIALYSVYVAGDVTLSLGWDGIVELSQIRSNVRRVARELAAILH